VKRSTIVLHLYLSMTIVTSVLSTFPPLSVAKASPDSVSMLSAIALALSAGGFGYLVACSEARGVLKGVLAASTVSSIASTANLPYILRALSQATVVEWSVELSMCTIAAMLGAGIALVLRADGRRGEYLYSYVGALFVYSLGHWLTYVDYVRYLRF